MPDLLTHVLGAYVLLTPLAWRVEWLEQRHVALAMVGMIVPDLAKVRLVIDATVVEQVLGGPWLWTGVHRLGPALALAGIGAMCFERGRRTVAFGWVVVGLLFHFLFDLAVTRANGLAPPYPYPLSWWHPPSADMLLSSDIWPAVVASLLAVGTWGLDWWMHSARGRQDR
ncbi:MAG: hypothetical protein ACI8XM_001425 [Haloarculaceae archaeon]|jgi:hypothetical protein